MSESTEQLLNQKEREIQLYRAIDTVRDSVIGHSEPEDMLRLLLKLMINVFRADAGALRIYAALRVNRKFMLTQGVDETLAGPLCEQVVNSKTREPQQLEAHGWVNTMGIPIVIDNANLGALILFRRKLTPFAEDDIRLLRKAEDQIDSAILQAIRMWTLNERNRELAAIYKLDQLRDETANETDLINGFTQVVVEQFDAELCMVITTHPETNVPAIRGVIDRLHLTPQDYDIIKNAVVRLSGVEHIPPPPHKSEITMIGSPFIVNSMRLGGVVIGRHEAFTKSDFRLLFAMSSQMDSALVYTGIIEKLTQRNQELDIIYQIDKLRDSTLDFDELLQDVLGELCRSVQSEIGYILLFNSDDEDHLEIKSSVTRGIQVTPEHYKSIDRVSRRALQKAEIIHEYDLPGKVHSIVAAPLILHDRIIGVFGGVNSLHAQRFTNTDQRMLTAIMSQVDTAIFERLEQRRLRQVLGRSVDPKVLTYLLAKGNAERILKGERIMLSVIFADMRGSTEWAERTSAEEVAEVLNVYLGRMTDIIFEFSGTLDKFVGDEVIGLFGAPITMDDHAEQSARAALKMQAEMKNIQLEFGEKGYEVPPIGVAISTGEAICGEFGTLERSDYTAIGRMMNLGARLCSTVAANEIIISEETYHQLGSKATTKTTEEIELKGIGKATAYRLLAIESVT